MRAGHGSLGSPKKTSATVLCFLHEPGTEYESRDRLLDCALTCAALRETKLPIPSSYQAVGLEAPEAFEEDIARYSPSQRPEFGIPAHHEQEFALGHTSL